MAGDYIPRPDQPFDVWFASLQNTIAANPGELGVSIAEAVALTAAWTAWNNAFEDHQVTQVAAAMAHTKKNTERATSEEMIRLLVGRIQSTSGVTDVHREALGITIPDRIPTPLSPELVLTTPPPLLLLDPSQRGQVTVHFGVNPDNEHENAKPYGMRAGIIWCAVGGIPSVDPDAGPWEMVAMDTKSPYIHLHPTTTAIKLAYKVQWADRLNRFGPFSDPVAVSLTAAP